MKRRIAPVLIFIAALAVPASASALPGPQGRLSQLPGTDGCVSEDGSDNSGNPNVCEDGKGLVNAFDIAISPDGADVYATGTGVASIARTASDGTLEQTACTGTGTCQGPLLDILDTARAVAVSPDGEHVYAVAAADAVLAMKRKADGTVEPLGAAAQLGGGRATDCIALNPGTPASTAGCFDGKALEDPNDVTVSPDGKSVYVTSQTSNAVAIFSRDASGTLTQDLVGNAGCASTSGDSDAGVGTCVNVPGTQTFNDPKSVEVSPDGNHVYVGSEVGGGLHVFDRDQTTGAMTAIECLNAAGLDGCTVALGVAAITDLDVAPNGDHVYVANSTDILAYLTRNETTGLLGAPNNCVSTGGGGCATTTARGLDHPSAVEVSPDNRTVYVTTLNDNSIATFSRNQSTGQPAQLAGAAGCVANQPGNPATTSTCADGTAMIGMTDVAVSPDGLHVYGTSLTSRSVTAFARQLPPQCVGGAVPGTIGPETRTIQLNCPDPNGDQITGYFATGVAHGSLGGLNIPAGTIQYTADPGYDGPDQILLNAQDNAPETGQAVILTLDVDTLAPAVAITSGPTEPATNTTPAFGFDSEDGATFECRFDGAPFAPCDDATGPSGSHRPSAPLAVGAHEFDVRATDAVGNAGAKASRAFAVIEESVPPPPPPQQDIDPPETTITKTKVNGDVARVKFVSDEAGSSFQCRIDKKPFKPCTSPRKMKNLKDGPHKFLVQATDAAGNTDPTPARSKFEVSS